MTLLYQSHGFNGQRSAVEILMLAKCGLKELCFQLQFLLPLVDSTVSFLNKGSGQLQLKCVSS